MGRVGQAHDRALAIVALDGGQRGFQSLATGVCGRGGFGSGHEVLHAVFQVANECPPLTNTTLEDN